MFYLYILTKCLATILPISIKLQSTSLHYVSKAIDMIEFVETVLNKMWYKAKITL